MPVFNRMVHFHKQAAVFFLTLGLLGIGGIWLLAYGTPFGLGLNDDSIAYIAGARSIMAGEGYREAWLVSNGPVTHFPPGFPGVLALIGTLTGLDPVRGARALNGLLFGLNIALSGWVGWRMTGSRIAGILAGVMLLLNSSFLYIHARAMSEPLYIFLTLISFLLLDAYFERSQNYWLVMLGCVLGWAYLARYAALSLLATMIATLLVLHETWLKRLKSALILALSAVPWILGWSIRNRIVGGNATNRVLGWHPITPENWELGIKTFADFLAPLPAFRKTIKQIPASFETILIVIGLSILIWVVYKGWPYFFRPTPVIRPKTLSFTNALYVIAYMIVLVLAMTIFDPATKFQVRILSPTFVVLVMLVLCLGGWLWHKKHMIWKPVIIVFIAGLLGMFAAGQIITVQDFRKGGDAFAGEKWYASEAMLALDQFPSDVLILTNEPGAVYLYTGRPAGVLPKTEPGISDLKEAVLDGEAVIVLFRVNKMDDDTILYYRELGWGLYPTDFSNTWMFSAFPE